MFTIVACIKDVNFVYFSGKPELAVLKNSTFKFSSSLSCVKHAVRVS